VKSPHVRHGGLLRVVPMNGHPNLCVNADKNHCRPLPGPFAPIQRLMETSSAPLSYNLLALCILSGEHPTAVARPGRSRTAFRSSRRFVLTLPQTSCFDGLYPFWPSLVRDECSSCWGGGRLALRPAPGPGSGLICVEEMRTTLKQEVVGDHESSTGLVDSFFGFCSSHDDDPCCRH